MRKLFTAHAKPDFWPPCPSAFWQAVLAPLRWYFTRRQCRIAEVVAEGARDLWKSFAPHDGIVIAPNHCHHSDPPVMMEVSRQMGRQFYFMAAWQIFPLHGGLDGWILQKYGAFSVDREGVDRRSVRQAVELLTTGNSLVVFPEGEISFLNDRLRPLLEGVAFMALTAQRELEKTPNEARVRILPTFIRYHYLDDIRPRLESAMTRLEERLLLKPLPRAPLPERVIRFGEVALTIKEKEILGSPGDMAGDLPTRLAHLINVLLEKLEARYLKKTSPADTVPLRVKALRRRLLDLFTDETTDAGTQHDAQEALDDLHLVLQLFSYPGDYLVENPGLERLAETIEKFEEDIYGYIPMPKGKRRARVVFGEAIDLKKETGIGRARTQAADITTRLERVLEDLAAATP